ncbi:MAG: nucleoside monophosphate kinase [Candidatus Paceibacterota bacterium]
MKGVSFPLFKTKLDVESERFNLEDPAGRKEYFTLKAQSDVEKIREYLDEGNTFLAILLGKKNSGKGTYSKLFAEAVGKERVLHISVGDMVRELDTIVRDEEQQKELVVYLEKHYRSSVPLQEAFDAIKSRSTQFLLPTELILALLRRKIENIKGKAIFIDGFPRNLDQISYSLYFRQIMGFKDDPDFFVFIDVPESIIDERMKYRVICPICHAPRNPRLLKTKDVGYDIETKEFYLMCDDPACNKARMIPKEGDSLGIEAIRDRIELDDTIMRSLLDMDGVSKIYLRNAYPVHEASTHLADYEITPGYFYTWDETNQKVITDEKPWTALDENGIESYSLFPAPIVVSLLHQIAEKLG